MQKAEPASVVPRRRSGGVALAPLALGVALVAGACATDSVTAPPAVTVDVPRALAALVPSGTTSELRVCKAAGSPAGTYRFTSVRSGTVYASDQFFPDFQLTLPTADGGDACHPVYLRTEREDTGGDPPVSVTITEEAAPGTTLESIVIETLGPNAPIPGATIDLAARSVTIEMNAFHGALATYFNAAVVDHGCTYTQGWYKNRGSGSLPAGDFALSGASYLGVLKTAPKGNPYYILAHQYIAATMNVAGGASTTDEVDAALAAAAAYFATATPADPLVGGAYAKDQLTALATTLDRYDNGIIGPGHCDG